ncbi:DNA polymerase iota isoform 2-T2 [Podargus strigoides]
MEPFPPPAEEDEEEWLQPGPSRSVAVRRVIVHIDLDCFYAQVEMIRNPALRAQPLGVRQKNIVVTCNYEARRLGVKKLMAVKEAKEKCPQLLLVNGEDLTPYREISYKVTELLGEFNPLVERLGMDEHFVDVTKMVEKRLNQLQQCGSSTLCVSGHVYNHQALNLQDTMHVRLLIGSQIAQEFREAILARLGLTGCAGVASNKLLSKLVSGCFKPNQQTLLLPESSQDLLLSLDSIQKVPGIGYKTSKRLETLGVRNICDLQAFPSTVLEQKLGISNAERIQKLSYGEDDSPVRPSGPPQSFSGEDSFKKCSSEVEVQEKIEELLCNLLERIHKDGRQPHTVRLSVRQFSSTEKWFQRESRQCPVPPHLLQKWSKESSAVISPLVALLMKLFRKMVDVRQPFHLTLLNICFSNLKDTPSSKKGSIGFYLKQTASPSGSDNQEVEDVSQSSGNQNCIRSGITTPGKLVEERLSPGAVEEEIFQELPLDTPKEMSFANTQSKSRQRGILLPPNVDVKTFYELPKDVQEELLTEWKNQESLSKFIRGKPPAKPQGRRNTTPCSSQSNSLLRYLKPQ